MDKIHVMSRGAGSFMMVAARECVTSGEQVSFLFSIVQIEDIVSKTFISRIPFSPPYLDGISTWRDTVLPVLSLDVLFGFAPQKESCDADRAMVVKTGRPSPARVLIPIASDGRILSRLPRSEPVKDEQILPGALMPAVKGIYRGKDGIIIVPDMNRILSGEFNDVFI